VKLVHADVGRTVLHQRCRHNPWDYLYAPEGSVSRGLCWVSIASIYLWAVNTKTFFGYLEFASGITEAHEGEDPNKNANCASRDTLESADIYSLTVVTEPVTKVDALQVMIISTWTVLVLQ